MYGGNRNVNITSADSKDNPKVNNSKRRLGFGDYLSFSAGISMIAIVYAFLWFIALNISNFYCWTRYDISCNSTNIIHWIFLAGVMAALVLSIAFAVQYIINAGYLFQRGVYLDRKGVSQHTQGLLDVMKTSARSEATYGLDTYSPSISKSVNNAGTPPIVDVVDGIDSAVSISGSPMDDVANINED